MGGGMDANNIPIGGLDLFNNVCYNWHNRTTDGNCHAVNFVNNYYKMGADTRKSILFTQDFESAINPAGKDQAYIKGNIRENKNHTLTQDAENVTYNATGNIPTSYQYRVSEPLFPSYATIHSAKDALKIVTSTAGATMPVRDEQHLRIIRETIDGTWTYKGSKSGIKGEIDNEADMPDWWVKMTGSDPLTANQNDDPDKDGWTLLEDYLEFMAHPYIVINPNSSGTLDLKPHFIGFYGQNGKTVTPSYSVDYQENHFSPSIDGSILTVKSFDIPCTGYCIVTVNDGETTFSQRFGVAVTGEASQAIHPVWSEEGIDVVKREFFTLDGKRVEKMQSHEVYLMKVTDTTGQVHAVKIIKN